MENKFGDAVEQAFEQLKYKEGLERDDDTDGTSCLTYINHSNVTIDITVSPSGEVVRASAMTMFDEDDTMLDLDDMQLQELPEQGTVITLEQVFPMVEKYLNYDGPFDQMLYGEPVAK